MKRCLGLVVAMLSLSCADGVGSEDCVGAGVRCKVSTEVQKPSKDLTRLTTKDLEELSPTWVRPLPILPYEPDAGGVLLRNDLEGEVWFFARSSRLQLVASKLDADGEIRESTEIAPPRGWKMNDAGYLTFKSYPQTAIGVALEVTWPTTDETYHSEGVNNEWIKLGQSVEDPIQRIVPGPDSPFYASDLIWDSEGSVFALKQPHGRSVRLEMRLGIEKYDRALNRVWKQSALRGYGTDTNVWFGLLDGHRVAAMIEVLARSTFSIDVLGADGNFEPSFGGSRLGDLNPSGMSVQQGPKGPVMVANNPNGDLVIVRMSANPRALAGVQVLREDYLSLSRLPNAVDRSGTVYVAPLIGGRAETDQRRGICRVPESGASRCFILSPSPELEHAEGNIGADDLAVHADGAVFLRTNSALARIDLPQD